MTSIRRSGERLAAGRVDDRERIAPPHEHPQRTLKLEPVGNPFHGRVGISSAYAPVRDGALGIRLQHA